MDKTSLCLCYTPKDGLFAKNIDIDDKSENILFREYNKKGFQESSFDVPNNNFRIKIKSNFKYCKASYLYAYIIKEGKELIDADINKIRILNNSNLTQFAVASEDWPSLFDKIIHAYNDEGGLSSLASLYIYIDEISKILSLREVQVKEAFHQRETTSWNKNLLLLLIGKKLEDLLHSIINIEDRNLLNKSLNLCYTFCKTLKEELNCEELNDLQKKQLSSRLLSIHNFLEENGAGVKFLECFII